MQSRSELLIRRSGLAASIPATTCGKRPSTRSDSVPEFAQPCDEPSRPAPRSAHHSPMLTRRKFAQAAAAAGAVLAFGKGSAAAPAWRERRDLYPQGVASGDPAPDTVLLWTRRQPAHDDSRTAYLLTVELAKDPAFREVV